MVGLWDIRRLIQLLGLDAFTPLLDEMRVGATISIPAPNVDSAMTSTVATEEDTFKALSRASIPEMLRYYEDWIVNGAAKFKDLEEMCSKYGWTWDEFSIAGARWRDRNV